MNASALVNKPRKGGNHDWRPVSPAARCRCPALKKTIARQTLPLEGRVV
jgi:hypothetical protein